MPTGPLAVLAAMAGCLMLLVLLLRRLASGAKEQRDPQRLFTVAQRQAGFARAGGRCEHKGLIFPRCTAAPAHGDHIFPWSKGGATSMANFQALCSRHNLRKSNHVPSRFYIWRLEQRRRGYFDDQRAVTVDYRIGVPPMSRY